MRLIDIVGETTLFSLFPPAARTATANGTGVDLSAYQGVIAVSLFNGTTSGTAPTLDVKIQDSADNSTYTDVSGYAFTQVVAAVGPVDLRVDTRNVRQYIRAVVTINGTTPSFTCSVSARGQKQLI